MKLLKSQIKQVDHGDTIHTADDVLEVVGLSANKQQLYCKNEHEEIFEIERYDLEAKIYVDI